MRRDSRASSGSSPRRRELSPRRAGAARALASAVRDLVSAALTLGSIGQAPARGSRDLAGAGSALASAEEDLTSAARDLASAAAAPVSAGPSPTSGSRDLASARLRIGQGRRRARPLIRCAPSPGPTARPISAQGNALGLRSGPPQQGLKARAMLSASPEFWAGLTALGALLDDPFPGAMPQASMGRAFGARPWRRSVPYTSALATTPCKRAPSPA